MSAHTPGPWRIEMDGGDRHLKAEGRHESLMCDMQYYPWTFDSEADWNLVAAAPDLLGVLHRCADLLDDYSDVLDGDDGHPRPNRAMSLLQDVEAAIAKAEGAK